MSGISQLASGVDAASRSLNRSQKRAERLAILEADQLVQRTGRICLLYNTLLRYFSQLRIELLAGLTCQEPLLRALYSLVFSRGRHSCSQCVGLLYPISTAGCGGGADASASAGSASGGAAAAADGGASVLIPLSTRTVLPGCKLLPDTSKMWLSALSLPPVSARNPFERLSTAERPGETALVLLQQQQQKQAPELEALASPLQILVLFSDVGAHLLSYFIHFLLWIHY